MALSLKRFYWAEGNNIDFVVDIDGNRVYIENEIIVETIRGLGKKHALSKLINMKTIFFLAFTIFNFSSLNAQILKLNRDYDIYLLLNSENNEMIKGEIITNDTLNFKTFRVTKKVPVENYKYKLRVNENGKLQKMVGSASDTQFSVTLFFSSPSDEYKKISKTSFLNIIDYKTLLSAKFESFLSVLKKATNIYVIDEHEQDDSLFYYVYEVSL